MWFSNSSLSNRHKGALLYVVTPVCAPWETERPRHLNVRGVLRRCVTNKGLHPLRRFAAIPPPKAKGVTSKVTPFAYYTVLRTPR